MPVESTRAAKLAGLRQLLDHLDKHPLLPVPTTVTFEVHAATDMDGFEAVAHAAHRLGVTATTATNSIQRAAKRFGPVELAYVYHPMQVPVGDLRGGYGSVAADRFIDAIGEAAGFDDEDVEVAGRG